MACIVLTCLTRGVPGNCISHGALMSGNRMSDRTIASRCDSPDGEYYMPWLPHRKLSHTRSPTARATLQQMAILMICCDVTTYDRVGLEATDEQGPCPSERKRKTWDNRTTKRGRGVTHLFTGERSVRGYGSTNVDYVIFRDGGLNRR